MLYDVLRYYFHINKILENRPFTLRELQLWIVENNQEIREEYSDSKSRTSRNNKVNAKKYRIERIFKSAINLGLIQQRNETSHGSESMYIGTRVQYHYTGSGILLNLLIRNMNLANDISEEKDRGKIEAKNTELASVKDAIYKLVDSTLSTGDESSSTNVFYKSFYKKVKDEGHFSKIINYITEICQQIEAENMNEVLRECYIRHFALENKSDRKVLLELWLKKLEEQSLEDRDLILYGEKVLTEVRFESKCDPSRDYERQRFKHRADYEKVVLEGKCEMCSKKNVIIWSYIEYQRKVAESLEADDLIRFNCQKCKKNSCVIPNF